MANLLLLADILEAASAGPHAVGEPSYSPWNHAHDSGTPACPLSHWYAYKGSTWLDGHLDEVLEEFALTASESADLFAPEGCGNAKTAAEAAAYIRAFVDRRAARERSGYACGMRAGVLGAAVIE
jgi:hypothetical protein